MWREPICFFDISADSRMAALLDIVVMNHLLFQMANTAAIHAKLDEIVVALRETRNDVVGLEHSDPKEIKAVLKRIEGEAEALAGATEAPTTATT
jgi:low affinity Fe/Cu permease